MTELEKIAYAKMFIDKLANGINPLDDQEIQDTDIVNNIRVSRCLFYVSNILRKVIENGGVDSRKGKTIKVPFRLDYAARENFRYSDIPIPISEITLRINELIQTEDMKKLSYKHVVEWLIQAGFLQLGYDERGKKIRQPTENGVSLGINIEHRRSQNGPYTVTVYDRLAQKFILDNLDAVIELGAR